MLGKHGRIESFECTLLVMTQHTLHYGVSNELLTKPYRERVAKRKQPYIHDSLIANFRRTKQKRNNMKVKTKTRANL